MPTTTDDAVRAAFTSVMDEYDRVIALGRVFPTNDPVRGVALITEEVGEAMKEALDLSRGESVAIRRKLYTEVTQVASTAIAMLVALDKTR